MEWTAGVVIIALIAAGMGGLVLIGRRMRRRGAAGQALAAAMAAFDEGFHSTAHDTFVEMKAQGERSPQSLDPRDSR